MPYQGNQPAEAYSSVTKDSFSGDGSTTAFTLSVPSTTNNLRVVVENVVQDPTVAYSVSGTTLTFTSAPPTGTNNIYAVNLGPAVQTVVPPDGVTLTNPTVTGDLTVDTNTLFVDSSANRVGVGTTTPSAPLHVAADSSTLSLRISGRSADDRSDVEFYENDNTTKLTGFTNEPSYSLWSYGTRSIYTDSDTHIFRNGSATTLARIDSDGLKFNGDTAAANALDDYEEGTWTATLTGTSSITNTQGFYTKIGRVVYFNYYSDAVTSNSAVSANVGGLPFNCISGTNAYTAVYTAHNTWCPTATGGYVNEGGSTIALTATGSINTAQTASSGTTYIMIAGWYLTSS